MESSGGIKLFNDESPDIVMPSENMQKEDIYVANQLGDAIDGAMVQRVLLPSTNVLDENNYVLNFTDIGTITVFQKEALKGLLYKRKKKMLKDKLEKSDDETLQFVTVYMYRKGKDITELGKGERYHLEKAIPLLKRYVFDNAIDVYKNYDPTKQQAEVVSEETVSFRLNL